MKIRIPFFSLFFTAVAMSGCVTLPPEKAEADPAAREGECKRARACGEALLQTLRDGDYAGFSALLSAETRRRFSEADFNAALKSMEEQQGEIREVQFLTRLQSEFLQNLVWKVRFERKGNQGRTIGQERLFQILVGEVDGKPQILGFGFLLPVGAAK